MEKNSDRKLIVFESDPDFSDNSRGLWEYIHRNTDYKTFWVVKDARMKEALQNRGVACGLKGSEEANYMIETARFLVTASFAFAYEKRMNQIHISAWHGFPLKLIGFFDTASASSNRANYEMLKTITTQSDMITATSRVAQLILSGLFAVDPRKVKETGYPRNDIMFEENAVENLKKLTDLDICGSKLVFYLPTMRKGLKSEGETFNRNIFNYPDYDPELLDEFLESYNAYIFTKMHFADNQFYKANDFKLPKRLIFLDTSALNRNFLTIYHIMNAFDTLITDYSSVYVDYLLLDKPILFSCPDIEQYQTDRGFIVDNPKFLMPGAVLGTQKELVERLEDVFEGKDSYKAARKNVIDFFHFYKDGNSAERVFNEMMKMDKNGSEDSAKDMGRQFYNPVSPISQYADLMTAEIFFDLGEGFSEENKKVVQYRISRDESRKVNICIDVPPETNTVRFDPDDIGRCVLQNLSIKVDDRLLEYTLVNGYEKDGLIMFESIDPQILINFQGCGGKEIHIEFECVDLYANAGKMIRNMNNELDFLDSTLTSIYDSNSWKLTKPLRKIGEKIGQIKNKEKRII